MNEIRLDKYLARIGLGAKTAPDLATLAAIHAAPVDAIPFEALDPLLGRPVKLDLARCRIVAERSIETAEELGRILDEAFNVAPPAPVAEIFARIAN